jgi:hypothetical protein
MNVTLPTAPDETGVSIALSQPLQSDLAIDAAFLSSFAVT